MTLTLTSKPGILDTIDLAPLAENFEIHGRNQGSDGKEESLVLTLYPLRSGKFVLPNFGLRVRSPKLVVNEQSENVPKVRFAVEVAPAQLHQRQFVRLTIEACDDGSLTWQRPQLPTREGLFLRPLNEDQLDVERDGERCTAHRWHWSALAATAGVVSLKVPMLEANKFGQRLRFPPPKVELDALSLPSWLPAEIAIGKPEISVMPIPDEWPVDRPMAWRLEVVGGYSVEALKNLLHMQLSGKPSFGRYEPVIEESVHADGVPRHAIVLHPVFSKSGDFILPELVFPWYDTETGQIRKANLPALHMRVFNPALQRLVDWLVGLGVALAVLAAAYKTWNMLGWRVRRHRALVSLERVSNVDELSRQLCAFSLRPQSTPASTLGEWHFRIRNEASLVGLFDLVSLVEAVRYGKEEADLDDLIDQAGKCIASSRPKP